MDKIKTWGNADKMRSESHQDSAVLESIWVMLAAKLTTWSLLAVGLAQLGIFRWWTLLLVSIVAFAVNGFFWRVYSPSSESSFQQREVAFLFLLLVFGLLLLCWPAEHFPQMGDSSIYPQTAAKLIQTGGLTYHYSPLDGLTQRAKRLFYVPSDEQFAQVDVQSYAGLLYGAYYVMDPEQNTIVSSRPPLAIVWMGAFGMLAGPHGMLYVTPLFSIASLITIYFLGKRLFDAGSGALAVIWLLMSFPQLHFARAPFAEMLGQFFVLIALYAWIAYLQDRRLGYIVLGVAAVAAGFAARLDVLLVLPILCLFLVLLVMRSDWKGLIVGVVSLGGAIAFTVWTINRPYVGATGELSLTWQLRFLRQLSVPLAMRIGLGGLLGSALVVALIRCIPADRLKRLGRIACSLAVVLGVGYALHIRPLMPEYVIAGGQAFPTHNEELMAIAAQYISPFFFWVAALGMLIVFWQRSISAERVLLVFFALSFGGMFFWKYTTARVYPVALRRLVPEVLPSFSLLGAFALRWIGKRPRGRWIATAMAGLVAVLLISVSGRYWFHQGALGAWKSLGQFDDHLSSDAVILFEPRGEGSVVGWFASPLWSFHQRHALLLNSDEIDGDVLDHAIEFWQAQGRDVYLASQQNPLDWWPGEFQGCKETEVTWKSSIIGESQRFPPYVWRFNFKFPIYKLGRDNCP